MHDSLYREIILEHWKNPLNYGVIENAAIDITSSNPLCGDEIRVMINVNDNKITEIKFLSQGCAISKASSSILTELLIGQDTKILDQLTEDSFLEHLGIMLTPARMKCALLSYNIIKKAFR